MFHLGRGENVLEPDQPPVKQTQSYQKPKVITCK